MWQPPEQREAVPNKKGFNKLSDIYGVGMNLQYIITGKEPYDRFNDWAQCRIPPRPSI
jgi:hypothetical protein